MTKVTCLLFAVILLLSRPAHPQTGQLPALIEREVFFGNPEMTGVQLSPDGAYLSFIKPHLGTRNIWVKRREEPFSAAWPITADTTRPVDDYRWSRDGKYVLYVQDKGGDENFHLYAVNPRVAPGPVPPARNLTALPGVRAVIYHLPQSDPNTVFVGLNDRDKAWHDLYQVNLATGQRKRLRENTARITGWKFDWNDKLRLATRTTEDGSTEILRVDEGAMTKIYSTTVFETSYPETFHRDNGRFYLVTNKGDRNLTQLILLDPRTGKEEAVEADPEKRVDFGGMRISEVTRAPLFTFYEDDRRRIHWKDAAFRRDFETVAQKLGGQQWSLGSSSADERFWIIRATSDTNPGEEYLFDRKDKTLTFLFRPVPGMPFSDLASMRAIRYPSSDGLEIPAYLTLPKGVPARNLPLVVFPHGGPHGRDYWGFDVIHQFLANRGYAVLAPNFRGSTGFGKQFLNAGNRQWGGKMQDDLTWGVKYLVDQGIADPKRVGIMGGSYGGYAALAGLAFTPEVYAAGVAFEGPSNLVTLLNAIPPYWEYLRKKMYEAVGDPTTAEGKAQLQRQSPLHAAGRMKAPLLVAQGANDPRVNQAESDQIVIALRDHGLPVEYLVAANEGHGFAHPDNNLALLAAIEKFLARHLGGRYQERMPDKVAKRLGEMTVDVQTLNAK
ncbi:MAG: S9 family peptidase [Cytophagales bacterium]|nr:S9 family peptidase [Cytophagales bacterium]